MSDRSEIEQMTREWRERTTDTLDRIENRIRALEDKQNKQDGGIRVALLICSGISSVIGWAISHLSK